MASATEIVSAGDSACSVYLGSEADGCRKEASRSDETIKPDEVK